MNLRNTATSFGIVTKLCHWLVFVAFVVNYFLAYRREYFPKGSDERLQYILLHKSIGMTVLAIGLLFILWHHFSNRPTYPSEMPRWERVLAKLTHILLFLAILAMPITGYFMSAYADKAVNIFGVLHVPFFVTPNKEMAKLFHGIHGQISYVVIGLVALHVIGALKHHVIDKNNILTRMLPFGK